MTPGRYMQYWAVAALGGWILGLYVFGGAGFSAEYMEAYGHEHEHYLEVIKSDPYKHYEQRPGLVPPGLESEAAIEAFRGNVAFVEEYVANADYKTERSRQFWHGLYFDFFNAGLVVALAWRFGWPALTKLLDQQAREQVQLLHDADALRSEGEARLQKAEAAFGTIPEQMEAIARETDARIERELDALQAANERSLAIIKQEIEERRGAEYDRAQRAFKQTLVREALDAVAQRYRDSLSATQQAPLIEAFATQLEQRAK